MFVWHLINIHYNQESNFATNSEASFVNYYLCCLFLKLALESTSHEVTKAALKERDKTLEKLNRGKSENRLSVLFQVLAPGPHVLLWAIVRVCWVICMYLSDFNCQKCSLLLSAISLNCVHDLLKLMGWNCIWWD